MSKSVAITKAADVGRASAAQSDGMTRKAAIVNQSDKLCAYVMTAEPHSTSAVHTHGELDTIVYAKTGGGKIVFNGGQDNYDLAEGDFALIPAYCEHQEVNESDHVITWIITRSGPEAIVNNLDGWGGTTKE